MTPARITADNAAPAGIRVLVCGGRAYVDSGNIWETLSSVDRDRPIGVLLEGGATGADFHAASWAITADVPVLTYAPDWKAHGKAAGPIRNKQMLTDGKPDLVIAFPGGKGTADMIRQAKAAGVEVIEVEK